MPEMAKLLSASGSDNPPAQPDAYGRHEMNLLQVVIVLRGATPRPATIVGVTMTRL